MKPIARIVALVTALGLLLHAAEGDVPPSPLAETPADSQEAAEEGATAAEEDAPAAEEDDNGAGKEPEYAGDDWSLREKASYLHGWLVAIQPSKQPPAALVMQYKLDIDRFLDGMGDVLRRRETTKVDPQTARQVMMAYAEGLQKEQDQVKETNIAAGKKFMSGIAEKEGVEVTDSGLAYEVLEQGDGPKPGPEDRVQVLYTGKLLDGTVFDSTAKRNDTPAEFGVGDVIRGWTEGLQLMPVGAKYRFYIPGDLAYPQGKGNIEPYATLIFEVELLGIE